jgi:hypothetical protein
LRQQAGLRCESGGRSIPTPLSSSAQAEDPVRLGSSVRSRLSLEYWVTRPRAQLRTRRVTTIEHDAASRDMNCPRFASSVALYNERAQGRPGARRTPGLVCKYAHNKRCTRAYRFGGSIPAFPAQWLYGLLRALPGERLFCLRRPQDAFATFGLNASTTAPEPHDFTVRVSHTRLSWPLRPSHLTTRQ